MSALGAGISAGVFFAFSTFVMRGLNQPAGEAVAAMQGINLAAPTPVFMAALFGTGALGLGVAVRALVDTDRPGVTWTIAGAAMHLATLALTAGFHVPRDNALAAIGPNDTTVDARWATYLGQWTTANHLRIVLCAGAAVACIVGCRRGT